MSTILMAPHTIQLTRANRWDVVAPRCWCGQDLEYVKGGHCPRCCITAGPWVDPVQAQLTAGVASTDHRAPEGMVA